MIFRVWLIVIFGMANICFAEDIQWQRSKAVQKLFEDAGLNGTFVLYDQKNNKFIGHNLTRAQQRYLPASTFKIPNTLIGLSAESVKSVDDILPYGGKPQPFRSWEKDMSLRDAIPISNVPIYQELARRTGLSKMQENVKTLSYGNTEVGAQVDNFWLVGPLKISAVEQVQFLAKLATHLLPYAPELQTSVKEIVLVESAEGWKLYGKTGWANATTPGIGWWVGWVERGGAVYSFAINIDINQDADAQKRIPLGRQSLEVLGVL